MNGEEYLRLVERYLTSLENRDLQAAAGCLAPGAVLVFPGGKVYSHPEEVAEGARHRYRWVRKTIERWDLLIGNRGKAVVYCLGTLWGEALDGTHFEGIRFIDRFELQDGLIARQEVWNDLAEAGVVRAGS